MMTRFKKYIFIGVGRGSGEHHSDPRDVAGEHLLVRVWKISKWFKKQALSSDFLEYNAQIFTANLKKLLSAVVHASRKWIL